MKEHQDIAKVEFIHDMMRVARDHYGQCPGLNEKENKRIVEYMQGLAYTLVHMTVVPFSLEASIHVRKARKHIEKALHILGDAWKIRGSKTAAAEIAKKLAELDEAESVFMQACKETCSK